ncbi:hypothetical protein L3Y34_011833 [Caenorhabditis briggsae]|uniref:Uncharacterized protein n=1 Tax=Caenorhabditis briggsae TaxID=6238 RepID=A0AAE8ZSD4_CAEBR|nr:hypothetical protein L3Y34_011833 [Caenorhabditis briggsae]
MEQNRVFAEHVIDQNLPPERIQREQEPEFINGVRPTMFAMAALLFDLVPPGDFLFLDDNDDGVTAVLYCEINRSYLCVIYQKHGRYTHYRHIPAQQAIQNN